MYDVVGGVAAHKRWAAGGGRRAAIMIEAKGPRSLLTEELGTTEKSAEPAIAHAYDVRK